MTDDLPTDTTPLGVVTYHQDTSGWWTAELGDGRYLGRCGVYNRLAFAQPYAFSSTYDSLEAAQRAARFVATRLHGADLANADLTEAKLRRADLDGADLSGACLAGANLREASLTDADLSGATLRGAELREADLSDAYLVGADLREADLRDAYLNGANLTEADLRGADLRGAVLTARLTGCVMTGAIYDPSTVFPEEFDPDPSLRLVQRGSR
jgi:hypothetical protein